MTEISKAFRAAALGRAPNRPEHAIHWLGGCVTSPAFQRLYDFWLEDSCEWVSWCVRMDNDERRMLLLFLAEAEA